MSAVSKRPRPTHAWKRSPITTRRRQPASGRAASCRTSGPAGPPCPLRWASASSATSWRGREAPEPSMLPGYRWGSEDRQLLPGRALPGHLVDHRFRDMAEGVGVRSLGLGDHDRHAAVAAEDDLGIERDRPQEGGAEELGGPLAAALLEDVGDLAAVRADERRHVLDDADHRHVDLLEHGQPLAGVDQR